MEVIVSKFYRLCQEDRAGGCYLFFTALMQAESDLGEKSVSRKINVHLPDGQRSSVWVSRDYCPAALWRFGPVSGSVDDDVWVCATSPLKERLETLMAIEARMERNRIEPFNAFAWLMLALLAFVFAKIIFGF